MSRFITLLVIAIICCAVSASVGYFVGERAGWHRATDAHILSSLAALAALKTLRAGDTSKTIQLLESECFDDSQLVLSQTGWRTESFRKDVGPLLTEYRRMYRTNQTEWTLAEEKLESLLTQRP